MNLHMGVFATGFFSEAPDVRRKSVWDYNRLFSHMEFFLVGANIK